MHFRIDRKKQRRTEKTATGSFAPIVIIPTSGLGTFLPLAFRPTSALRYQRPFAAGPSLTDSVERKLNVAEILAKFDWSASPSMHGNTRVHGRVWHVC